MQRNLSDKQVEPMTPTASLLCSYYRCFRSMFTSQFLSRSVLFFILLFLILLKEKKTVVEILFFIDDHELNR